MRSFLTRFAGILLVVALVSPAVHAADKSPDAVRAETLFDEGRRLMAAGKFDDACPKFAQSQALDPAPGTALNLAACYEKAGKLASAWSAYRSAEAAASSSRQKDRAALAKKKAAGLQTRLSRLTVVVPSAAQTKGLDVRLDGEPIQSPEWGVPVPRDGGQYELQASAAGKKSWTARVELKPTGQNLVIEISVLEDAPPPAPVVDAAPKPSVPLADAATTPKSKTARRGGTQRTIGLVVGGLGIAGLGAGGAIGLLAKTQFDKANKELGTQQTLDSRKAVKTGNMGTVAAAVGGGLLATGLIVWLSAPSGDVAVGTNGEELFLTGSF